MMPWGGWGGMGWGGGLGMGIGLLLNLVVLVAIVAAIVYGTRWLFDQGRRGESPGSDSALEILRSRYARGEIDREEFEAKKRDLTSG